MNLDKTGTEAGKQSLISFQGNDAERRMNEAGKDKKEKIEEKLLPRSTIFLFAIACGISVANVYYAQPLLDAMSRQFNITEASAGIIITATQIGCALALIGLVPLGDMLNRRKLLIGQLIALVLALVLVITAKTKPVLLTGMAALGLLGTAMTQGLLAYAATLARPSQRGRVVGAAQGGVVVGLLLARTVAGLLADIWGWRSVYILSAILAGMMILVLYKRLPDAPVAAVKQSYWSLLRSMYTLFIREPVLRTRSILAMFMFAVFSAFWTTMVLPLSGPPHELSHTMIGSFGLIGVVGILGAGRAGALWDQGKGEWTTGLALLLLLLSWLPIAFTQLSLWALVAGVLLLDLAAQALHVTNQGMIFDIGAESHSRVVGVYMIFYAIGSGSGSIAGTTVYAHYGWLGLCLLGAVLCIMSIAWWRLTLPVKSNK
ncbi:MFS transporter [Pseudobacter ginsenosidimutans]|uniref:Putative MFS family arabinose efflux permease n=1 Tax=Pseudobacter ginsenosidimutans TaxID=661488 RepID=A0A4Q7N5G4_9BACT|nr:MFS transporter [Pseudobacter ginsenosidimutans]RZS76292.1 putative MFS family arabinose efflux permease [Pseudobacter ginsenosidimutans]